MRWSLQQAYRVHLSSDFDIIIIGYVIMRLMLILQWVRAAKADPERRSTINKYIIGITVVQMGWVFFHFSPINFSIYFFLALVLAELSVPFFAEKSGATPWHPHHITERYALLTIIVLGESIIASFNAISDAVRNQAISSELIFLTIGGVIMMFTMWWMYFDRSVHDRLNNHKRVFIWGYGHYFIFISIASVGAAVAAAVDVAASHSEITHRYEGCIVAVTLITYSFCLWLLHDLPYLNGLGKWFYPLTAVVIFIVPFVVSNIGYSIFIMALVYAIRLFVSKWIFKSESLSASSH